MCDKHIYGARQGDPQKEDQNSTIDGWPIIIRKTWKKDKGLNSASSQEWLAQESWIFIYSISMINERTHSFIIIIIIIIDFWGYSVKYWRNQATFLP